MHRKLYNYVHETALSPTDMENYAQYMQFIPDGVLEMASTASSYLAISLNCLEVVTTL